MYQTNQQGRSMIEMLGVLAVIGILTVGGFNLVMKARTQQTLSEVTDTMTSLAAKVRHIVREYELDKTSTSTLKQYTINAKAFPEVLKDSWTDRNDVTYDVTYVGTNPMFWVNVSGLTEEMCLHMSNANYGTGVSSGFVGLSYGTETTIYSSPVA